MPTPIMPKRTRSLAGTGAIDAMAGSGSRNMELLATSAPAAVTLDCRNSRRENREVMIASEKHLSGANAQPMLLLLF